jgi:hypothetical protein
MISGSGTWRMNDWVRYSLAVVGYVVISFFTKTLLTWTTGPMYFIAVLEVLPRTVRWIRAARTNGARA